MFVHGYHSGLYFHNCGFILAIFQLFRENLLAVMCENVDSHPSQGGIQNTQGEFLMLDKVTLQALFSHAIETNS